MYRKAVALPGASTDLPLLSSGKKEPAFATKSIFLTRNLLKFEEKDFENAVKRDTLEKIYVSKKVIELFG